MFGQLTPIQTYDLPNNLNESSGIARYNEIFFTHNDGGNPNEIYALDSTGKRIATYLIQNASNIDWEAVQITAAGDLIIADIGNNGNNRQDLRFYWISDFLNSGDTSLIADTISFSYAQQTAFPPASNLLHFDAEAFIIQSDSLLIFSKNRSNPYNGFSYMHYVPLQKGTHSTQLIDSLYTGGGPKEFDWITDASLQDNTLWLLSHGFALRFDSFTQNRLKSPKNINLGSFSQKEAIAYHKPYIWITDEKNSVFGGGKLYQYLVDSLPSNSVAPASRSLQPYLKVDSESFTLLLPHASILEVYSLDGKQLKQFTLSSGNNTLWFNQVQARSFLIKIKIYNQPYHYRFLSP